MWPCKEWKPLFLLGARQCLCDRAVLQALRWCHVAVLVLQHYPPRQLPTLPPANATTTEQVLIAVANLTVLKTKRKNSLQHLLECRLKHLRFGALKKLNIILTALWNATLCSLVEKQQHFRATCCCHPQIFWRCVWLTHSSKIMIFIYQTKRHHIPQDSNINWLTKYAENSAYF